ncbi:MSMEG_4193 family putative phosphomutase [Actinospica sp. MGRD01-02]|uniref:MSMEG_4193 family putative phosphomutase n=1 Tax=Actinospica acidithermotolerans TaxID=2828514 RepID=A0A941EDA0_9ACTN|nr:MSMEG_4193 family putative phosphomutase [Actinospica acidithermotolerans]MBR7828367.1 MSMEG_4193 family putative phosphomutase [Actinospica acidithermotolerans]
MTTVLLVRHGRSTANTAGVLAGRTPGVNLDERGEAQALELAARLMPVHLDAVVSSPLERTRQTAERLAAGREGTLFEVDERFTECDYGTWSGRPLKSLAEEPLWRTVQAHPAAAAFPDGESLAALSARAVSAVRAWNAKLGEQATYAVVSHGDVIKAVAADALGMHLDLFQRINVDPCSLTVIRYHGTRPSVLRLNDLGGDVSALIRSVEPAAGPGEAGDAPVGGGAGS